MAKDSDRKRLRELHAEVIRTRETWVRLRDERNALRSGKSPDRDRLRDLTQQVNQAREAAARARQERDRLRETVTTA